MSAAWLLMIIPTPFIAIGIYALIKERKEKRVMNTPYKIERVLDNLEYYLSVKYKITILKNRLYTIRKIYLPELHRIEQEYLYEKRVEPIQRSIDFSKSFRTKEATIDFLTNETKPLLDAFETELIETYNRNIESEKNRRSSQKAIDKAYDEELLKKYKSLT